MSYAELLFICTLLFLSWQDWRTLTIDARALSLPAFLGVLYQENHPILLTCLYIGCLVGNTLMHEIALGNGDIDVIACGALLLPLMDTIVWLTISCACQLCVILCRRQKHTPFVPALSLGFGLTCWFIPALSSEYAFL